MPEFSHLLQLLNNGQPVDAETFNRVYGDLDQNDRYLLQLINLMTAGQGVYLFDQPCNSALSVGMPVYYDTATEQFEKALASAVVANGAHKVADSARVWGVVTAKPTAVTATLLIGGAAKVDLSLAVDGSLDSGLYYLSGTNAGKLTLTEPPISVPILERKADGMVLIRTNFYDLHLAHQHYAFDLKCMPAGDATLGSGRYTITNTNTALEGWLPANHASFNGKAPAGAVFGYNIAASSLKNAWPPIPLHSALLEWDRGDPDVGGTTVPMGANGLAVIDINGIWWMSNCSGHQPWPDSFVSATTTSTTGTTTTSTAPPCPPVPGMRMRILYAQLKFQTNKSVVQKLVSLTPWLIVQCADGTPGDAGPLTITGDLGLTMGEVVDKTGHVVFKNLTEDGEFELGPVVEGLKGVGNVQLSSAGGADVNGFHYGKVTATVLQNVLGGELPVGTIRLSGGATQENYADVLGLGLAPGKVQSYRAEVSVPEALGVTSLTVGLRFWILGRVAGTLPALTLTARVIPKPTTPTNLPTTDAAVTLTMGQVVTQDQYIQVTSANINVTPGSTVLFTLKRNIDAYAGELHVIRQVGVVTGVTP